MIRMIAAALAFVFTLAACTTANQAAAVAQTPSQTPAQIAAQLCPPLQAAITGLAADTGLPQGTLSALAAAAPRIAALCAGAPAITSDDLLALESLAFNTVLPVAQAQNPQLAADLIAVQIVVDAVQAAQSGNADGAPAVVPAAASTSASGVQ